MESGKKGKNRGLVMLAVFIATFMTSVEVTIVTTALPSIISELHGLAFQSWIMSAYLLTTAITTPIYGKLADTLGRKKVFQFGVIVFSLGSLLSGLSPSIIFLIMSRALQGIGAGAVMPLTFTIIADYYSFEERARIMAFNNTAWGLSALIGPLLGGFLVDNLSWHWVFFVNVPLGLIVFVVILIGYQEQNTDRKMMKIDWLGITWLSIGLIGVLLAVQNITANVVVTVSLLVMAAISFWLFIRQEGRFSDPLIPMTIFKNQTFNVQIITVTILSGVLIGFQVYLPIWLQSIYRIPATGAGMVVTSSSIMWLISSFFVGTLIAKLVPKMIALSVMGVQLVFYLLLVFAGIHFPVWIFYIISAVNGAGLGIIISMNTVLSQHLVSDDLVGTASAILTLGRALGQTVMTGVYGAVLNIVIQLQLHGIPFSEINNVISSNSTAHVADRAAVNGIVLNSLHAVFTISVILLITVMIVNFRDPNKEVIK
ncbi:MFS transporter [Lentilactobacillus sp. Marseille-Q4993]|uniref:MFS transporter n=1 Tax=Lentilactobacillus sp. Marseille-Q4993 TaxID=3039492 RepID=UPI0024BD04D2|nr:MFS transporter [Lentilactobacillus sp. Marseille-Q4993]